MFISRDSSSFKTSIRRSSFAWQQLASESRHVEYSPGSRADSQGLFCASFLPTLTSGSLNLALPLPASGNHYTKWVFPEIGSTVGTWKRSRKCLGRSFTPFIVTWWSPGFDGERTIVHCLPATPLPGKWEQAESFCHHWATSFPREPQAVSGSMQIQRFHRNWGS